MPKSTLILHVSQLQFSLCPSESTGLDLASTKGEENLANDDSVSLILTTMKKKV